MEVKRGLKAIRELRDALVQLASWLARSPGQQAYLVLVDPGVTDASAQAELKRFKAALRPEVANRLHLVEARDGEIEGLSSEIPGRDWSLLWNRVRESDEPGVVLPRPDMRSEVMRLILLQWFKGAGAMTSEWLASTAGCSYRTVASAIERLGRVVERLSDRRIRLTRFPDDAWRQFAATSQKARATMNYIDRSGEPRSPQSLVRRLESLGLRGVAIGGVLGASFHQPNLNIVGAPRLDLCIHAPGKTANIDFVNAIDPGLRRTDDPDAPARLTLHFLRRKEPMFSQDAAGIEWADPVECLADLYEGRLEQQAVEFQEFISQQGTTQA